MPAPPPLSDPAIVRATFSFFRFVIFPSESIFTQIKVQLWIVLSRKSRLNEALGVLGQAVRIPGQVALHFRASVELRQQRIVRRIRRCHGWVRHDGLQAFELDRNFGTGPAY